MGSSEAQRQHGRQHPAEPLQSSQQEHTKKSNTPNNGMKKSVSWAEAATVRLALHLKDYTKSERQASFYNRYELLEMKKELVVTSIMRKKGLHIDEIHFSCRGVDLSEDVKLRKQRRQATQYAVFTEQMNNMIPSRHHNLHGFEDSSSLSLSTEEETSSVESDDEYLEALSKVQEGIAKVYSHVVHGSVAIGYRIGLSDEQFVKSLESRYCRKEAGFANTSMAIMHGRGLFKKMFRKSASSTNRTSFRI